MNKESKIRPKIIAHRGASFFSKENTIKSYQRAIELGADVVELDIQMTKDNKLILLHDVHIDRISEGTGLVRNFTLEDIRKINIFGKEKIPTLDEALEILLGKVGIVIDLKRLDAVPYLLKYLKNEKLRDTCIVSSFKKEAVKSIKHYNSGIKVGLICWRPSGRKIRFCKKNNFDYIHPNYMFLDRRLFGKIKKSKLGINVWTINYKRSLKRICKRGVSGIITDRPKMVKNYLDKTY